MRIAALIGFFAFVSSILPGTAEDWYRWRGPDLNGISKETGWLTEWPAEGPKRLWKAAVGTGFSTFSTSKGRVYTMGNAADSQTVFCFNADTGDVIWKHSYDCPLDPKNFEGGPAATPTIDGNRVYTFSRKGHLNCLDATDGKVIWSKNLMDELGAKMPTWGLSSSALIEGKLLVLNIGTAGAALDKNTGEIVWKSGGDEAGYATPVPFQSGPDLCLAIMGKASLIMVKLADGSELWSYPWKTEYDINAADPIFAGEKVLISSGYNHGAALLKMNGKSAEKVWENRNMRNHFNSCVLWKGYLYGDDENQLRCVDFETGEAKWAYREFGKGSLMLADGKLVALSDKGELIIAEATPEEFKPLARSKVLTGKCWTMPVLSDGRIYCRNAVGDVVCLDVRKTQTAQK